ncbi:MAG TPA: methyltransferase [Anaeromyxobacteraceae bacterium]|nr:methyltransferase [Anaeromyxobacteraceae bacterium]
MDLSLAALCLAFAWAQLVEFARSHRPSALLIVVTEILFAGFFLVRRPADAVSRSPWDWIATAGGVLAPLLLRPSAAGHDLLAAQVLQIVGGVGSLFGVLHLNRSVGVVPAHRVVRWRGAYRLVRHPLYASYLLTGAGYVLSNPSAANAVVLAAGMAFQVARIFNEERFLSRYPEYRRYQALTRWRLIPYVF